MNEVETIQMEQNRLKSIVKAYAPEHIYTWAVNTLDFWVKKYFSYNNVEFRSYTVLALKHLYKFFSMFNDEWVGEYLVFSIYFILVELDVMELGNEIEETEEFREDFDQNDWSSIDRSKIFNYDYSISNQYWTSWVNGEKPDLAVVGLNTILTMPYMYKHV